MKISQTKNVRCSAPVSCPHTDLACECAPPSSSAVSERYVYGFKVLETVVETERDQQETGRKRGRYTSIFCPFLSELSQEEGELLSLALAALIKELAEHLEIKTTGEASILVAGLGNRFITSDAIGPRAADNILATAHLNRESKDFKAIGAPDISIIIPGVSAQSGFDSFSIISSAAKAAEANLIIAIDALASRSTERLCTTFQISDSGIHPGSGIGNHRTPITRETVGVPVIAIGIPTVISSATLIYDALESFGQNVLSSDAERIIDAHHGFFVSPGDSDTVCDAAAEIIAGAIEKAFLEKIFF